MTKGWYLVIVAITFHELLTPTFLIGGTEVSTGTFSSNVFKLFLSVLISLLFSVMTEYVARGGGGGYSLIWAI